MNCFVGVLASSKLLVERVSSGLDGGATKSAPLLEEMQKLFHQVKQYEGETLCSVESSMLFKALGHFNGEYKSCIKQMDFAEALSVMLWCIEACTGVDAGHHEIGGIEDICFQAFGHTITGQHLCVNACSEGAFKSDPNYVLILPINRPSSVAQMLAELEEGILDEGLLQCSVCMAEGGRRRYRLVSVTGDSLCVLFQCAGEEHMKNFDIVEINENVNVCGQLFGLSCVVVHNGPTTRSGHYWYFRRVGQLWYKTNDSVVTRVSLASILVNPFVMENVYAIVYHMDEAVEPVSLVVQTWEWLLHA